jgi:hypothetical protein
LLVGDALIGHELACSEGVAGVVRRRRKGIASVLRWASREEALFYGEGRGGIGGEATGQREGEAVAAGSARGGEGEGASWWAV